MKYSLHNLEKGYLFLIQVFIYMKNISDDIILSFHTIHVKNVITISYLCLLLFFISFYLFLTSKINV